MSTTNIQLSPRKHLAVTLKSRFGERFSVGPPIREAPQRLISRGLDDSTGSKVIFQSATGISAGVVVRLQHEAVMLEKVDSPFLFRTVESSFAKNAAVVVDEFVEGTPLSEVIEGKPLGLEDTILLAQSLFGALSDLHRVGVYHLDVRPGKLIVRSDGSGTLLRKDLSVAELSTQAAAEQLHRVYYISPEQAGSIERDVHAPADLYSAGALLFFALTGKPPYSGGDTSRILLAHMTAPLPRFQDFGVHVPRCFERVVHRLLSKDPSNRYQTAEAVRHDINQISADLKRGISEPQIVIGSQDDRSTLIEPAFVGRTSEVHSILSRMRNAADGHAQTVFLEGTSGSGKSRLLVEVCQHAASSGFQIFRGLGANNAALGQSILDGTVDDLVANARTTPSFRDAFFEQAKEDLPVLATMFPGIAEVYGEHRTDLGPADFAENRTLRALCTYLSALGSKERPALVILDDCQWADGNTYKLLKRWAQSCNQRDDQHVLLLVACRSEEVDAGHPLRDICVSAEIQLAELSVEEVCLLAESMAGSLPSEAKDLVVNAANGSPFMASAVMRGLVESGAILRDKAGWSINKKEFADCQSSNDAGAFLTRRLELLSSTTRDILTTAAVLGKEFDLDAVQFLTERTAAESIDAFQEARTRNMVWVRGINGRGVFSHDKIRETLLARVSDEDLRGIHRRAGEFLAAQPQPDAANIAFHFDAAGEQDLALPFALEAAEDAVAHSSLDVARKLYVIAERASSRAENDVQFRINKGLGDVLMLLGDYEASEAQLQKGKQFAVGKFAEAEILGMLASLSFKRGDLEYGIVNYEAALSTLGRPVPNRRWKFAVSLVCNIFLQVLHTYFPRIFIERKGQATASDRLSIKLLSGVVHCYWYTRGKTETLWAHFYALNLAESFKPTPELASVYSEHAPAMSLMALNDRAIRYAQKAFEICGTNPWGQGKARCFKAVPLYASSQFEEAITQGRESIRLLESVGDYWSLHIARYQVAVSLWRLGRFREAVEECKKNYDSGIAVGDKSTGNIVNIWAQASNGELPVEYLKTELNVERIDMQTRCEVLMADGIYQLRRGKIDRGIERFNEGIRVIKETGVSNCFTAPVHYWKTHALRRKAELQTSAIDSIDRAATLSKALRCGLRSLLETFLCRNDYPRILRELGLIRFMQGHPVQARWLLESSMKRAANASLHYDYAETLRVFGEIAQKQGWVDADKQVERAKSLLSTIAVESGIEEEAEQTTLSLADRFDTILEVGRRITSALIERDVYEQTRLAAMRLLRCEECVIVEEHNSELFVVAGQTTGINKDVVRDSISSGRVTVGTARSDATESQDSNFQQEGSLLCAPIHVLGNVTACLCVTHNSVRDLFGSTEESLADFISSISGASLENSQQYNELQSLNLTLEDRVAERTDQLRHAIKEANSANEAKSRFLATMSHEIRTPMNGILGMAELALKTELTPQQKNCLQVVKQSGETLLMLLNEVLDLSKIESGKMEVEFIEFNVREVVENSVQLLAVAAHAKGLEVICDIEPNVPLSAVGDPNRIRQIIINLFGNAVKFTSVGEVIVTVSVREEGQLQFAVRDTGIGIPTEKQHLIFEAFRQSDSSTTRQYGGTGLGLSICRQLAELMGGEITLESEFGEGSTFVLRVPCEYSTETQESLQDLDFASLTCVFASEHPSTTRASQSLLQCLGLSVLPVNSLNELGDDCLQDLDLALIDEPTESEQSRLERLGVPAIACTLPSEIGSNVIPSVSKPMNADELSEVLRGLLFPTTTNSVEMPPQDDEAEAFIPCRVLLADDSIVNQEVAKGLLEFAGHTVVTADNGLQAVMKACEDDFDIVLMDLEMPEMDGLEATAEIRSRINDMPIVALSANTIADIERRCEGLDMNGYASKPIEPDQLFKTIQNIVAERRLSVTA